MVDVKIYKNIIYDITGNTTEYINVQSWKKKEKKRTMKLVRRAPPETLSRENKYTQIIFLASHSIYLQMLTPWLSEGSPFGAYTAYAEI
jgi:hypothetical protein